MIKLKVEIYTQYEGGEIEGAGATLSNDSFALTDHNYDVSVATPVYASELHGIYLKYCTDNELDPVQYTQMLEWISKNTDPEMCRKKRIHKTGTNPLAGFSGIRIVK